MQNRLLRLETTEHAVPRHTDFGLAVGERWQVFLHMNLKSLANNKADFIILKKKKKQIWKIPKLQYIYIKSLICYIILIIITYK